MTKPLRIMVTNDDGIDSVGLHVLARAMRPFGDVSIIAPDGEFSGSGASIGPIWEHAPEIHEDSVAGIETSWTVSGPPALCVLLARQGAFGDPPELIVSGINPGANVGRSVYHSGTIGAALTGRNAGIPGIAVSQSVHDFGAEGQAWGEVIAGLHWETAATITAQIVEVLLSTPRTHAGVLNLNVPDLALEDIKGWQWTRVGAMPPRAMAGVELTPKPGHLGSYQVGYKFGESADIEPGTDTAAIMDNQVALSWLSPIVAEEPNSPGITDALNQLL